MELLLVDDDPTCRAGLGDFLREDGFAVHVYGSPSEVPALETLGRIAVVVTDYEMPDEDGLAFADRFHAVHPNIPIVLLTGYHADWLAGPLRARAFVHLCGKPFVFDEISVLLHRLASRE